MERALDAFSGRLKGVVARHNETTRGRLEALRGALMPRGALQERSLSMAYFPGKYDDSFVEAYVAQLGLDPQRLQIILL
jgi:hypothetical protein